MLIVSYLDANLRDRCTEVEQAIEWLGTASAHDLLNSIDDIEASANAGAFLKFHGGCQTSGDTFYLPIGRAHQAVFEVRGTGFNRSEDGALDWSTVRRLALIDVEEL